VTFAHGEDEIDRPVRALRDLVDERCDPAAATGVAPLPSRRDLRTEQAMLPRGAFFAQSELVKPSAAVGPVSAELVTPYPPGIPAAARGEVYNEAIVADQPGRTAGVGGTGAAGCCSRLVSTRLHRQISSP
jgi:hypothetical protein